MGIILCVLKTFCLTFENVALGTVPQIRFAVFVKFSERSYLTFFSKIVQYYFRIYMDVDV